MEYKGKILKYLNQSFGWSVRFEDFTALKRKLTYGLLGAAEYSVLRMEDMAALAVKPVSENDFRLNKKIVATVGKKTGMAVVLIIDSIDSYQRRSLIENRINFIVPDRQIYLPAFGILLSERGLGVGQYKNDSLSPVATAVILYHLAHKSLADMSISEIAGQLGYSIKSLSLAVSELERYGLVSVMQRGRKKLVRFPHTNKDLWERAYPVMANPVEKRLFTDNVRRIAEIGIKASDSALSEISMLAGPQQEAYAVYARDPRLKELTLNPNDGEIVVEIWKTDPKLTAANGIADRFSLALSYKGDDDPRINMELERILNERN